MCSLCISFNVSRSALASSTLSYSPAYRNIGLSLIAFSALLLYTTHFSYTVIYTHCRRALITQCSVSPRGFLSERVHATDSPPLAPPANIRGALFIKFASTHVAQDLTLVGVKTLLASETWASAF